MKDKLAIIFSCKNKENSRSAVSYFPGFSQAAFFVFSSTELPHGLATLSICSTSCTCSSRSVKRCAQDRRCDLATPDIYKGTSTHRVSQHTYLFSPACHKRMKLSSDRLSVIWHKINLKLLFGNLVQRLEQVLHGLMESLQFHVPSTFAACWWPFIRKRHSCKQRYFWVWSCSTYIFIICACLKSCHR